jgi:DNA-binding response OmpR family regulator
MHPGQTFSTREPSRAAGSRPSLLLAEDEDAFRTLLANVLVTDGYDVHAVADGRAALQYLDRHPVDAIVTDICMPDFDGYELLTELRERGAGAPVLVMSGGVGSQIDCFLTMARQLGATATLAKPFPLEKLLAAVRGMVAQRR